MNKLFTKAVIVEPRIECPTWISEKVEYKAFVILSGQSDESDVELFLTHLFLYNGIDLDRSLKDSFNDLFNEEHVILHGGIAFFEGFERSILPSCCCGLEDIDEIRGSINKRVSPWLGHDPTPGIIYYDNYIRVCSYDPSSNHPVIFIDYTYEEIYKCLKETRVELLDFIEGPLFSWLNQRDSDIASEMIIKMKNWFVQE
ncbi:hypothetical protein [Paenibacillus macerans]|uniref:hypothetical protein n=1 Tax=Paenibacillus macerans TaxID=44252 RepID=UPI00203F6176|nr:hypothetical protein [Paenibacillus macerans]MCM3700546.1 hypothetical protein [Paenibacillus macerans]